MVVAVVAIVRKTGGGGDVWASGALKINMYADKGSGGIDRGELPLFEGDSSRLDRDQDHKADLSA